MTDGTKPDPLADGHIPGQNPSTPERLPGNTENYDPPSHIRQEDNEEELGGRPAFLFMNGDMAAVTLDSSGGNLPRPSGPGRWTLARYFTLGVRDAGLAGVIPETLIRGVLRDGFYVWRTTDPSRGEGTSQ